MRQAFLILFSLVCFISHADTRQIVLEQKGPKHDREGQPLNFDMPLAYYYYEVEHTGEVRLCGGFKVDKGVKFSIKPSNYNK